MSDPGYHHKVISFHCKTSGVMEDWRTEGDSTIPFNHTNAFDANCWKSCDLKANTW